MLLLELLPTGANLNELVPKLNIASGGLGLKAEMVRCYISSALFNTGIFLIIPRATPPVKCRPVRLSVSLEGE